MYGGDDIPAGYAMRYIKTTTPIITVDFESDPEVSGMDLTIKGLNIVTESSLSDIVHNDLVETAVELATLAYKENTLQNQVGINK